MENTDFLQAVTLLTTRKRNREYAGIRPPAVSAKREDVLKLTLADYLEWVEPLREAFTWASDFLADRHIFDTRFLPYPKQLVPLAAIRVVMGSDADLIGPRAKLVRWLWCGILGELYGGAIETRFVRDLEQVPAWARGDHDAATPNSVNDATFVESRLHSLRTRNAAAYKGIDALLLGNEARDWMEDKALDKVQYVNLAVDIHHIFPKKWCADHDIDDERRESIVNKTAISAVTNRTIGGAAPSSYLWLIEQRLKSTPTIWTAYSKRTSFRPSCCARTTSTRTSSNVDVDCVRPWKPRWARACRGMSGATTPRTRHSSRSRRSRNYRTRRIRRNHRVTR